MTLVVCLLWTTSATGTLMWGNYVLTTPPAWEPTWQAGYPTAVTSTDVNGDGFADLITVNSSSSFTILTNDARKGFVRAETVSAGHLGPVSLAIADVNGDCSLDFISANVRTNNLSVFTNSPTGFKLSSSPQVGFMPYDQWPYLSVKVSVTANDLNGDGLVDLVSSDLGPVIAPYGNTLTVLTNAGGGVFKWASTLTVGSSPSDVLSIDVNHDGWIDLIAANQNSDTVSVLTNDCTGHFQLSSLTPVGSKPWCLTTCDINADGQIDIVCGNMAGRTLSLLTNNGAGVFFDSSTIPLEQQTFSVAAADVNADGNLDLFAGIDGGSALVFTNDGHGSFSKAASLAGGTSLATSVTAVDIDNDGHVDLVRAHNGSSPLSIFLNRPFVPTLSLTPTASGQIQLSWPAVFSGFSLLQKTELATDQWTPVTAMSFDDGTNKTVILNAPAPRSTFFRLIHQP